VTPDLLCERRAASRPRVHDRGAMCWRVHAARRAPVKFLTQRRAWPEGRALGAGLGLTPQEFCDRISRWRDMTRLLNISNDDFIRTTESVTSAGAGAVAGIGAPRRDLSRPLCRCIRCATRPFTPRANSLTARRRPGRGRVARGGQLLLSAIGLARQAFGLYEPIGGDHPRSRRNEVISFVNRAQRFVDLAHQLQLGIPVPGNPARDLCVARRADQLHHRDRLSRSRSGEYPIFWPADLHMSARISCASHGLLHAFLMAAGSSRRGACSPWLVDRRRPEMSKSLGNFIAPKELVDRYGLDPLRYFLLRELPFGSDGDFSHRAWWSAQWRLANDSASGAAGPGDDQSQLRGAVPAPGP